MEGRHLINDLHFDKAKTVCGQILTGNWANKDAVETSVLSGGYVNFIIACSLKEQYCDQKSLPHKVRGLLSVIWGHFETVRQVLVRLLSGKNDVTTMGEAGEALAFDALGKAGLGPKLLGVFDGGRIEEYIDSRFLTNEEFHDVRIVEAIARNIARMHSLDIPIRKDPEVQRLRGREFISEVRDELKTCDTLKDLTKFEPHVQELLKTLLAINWLEEYDWLHKQLTKVKSRVVCLSHGDVFGNNIIVIKDKTLDTITDEDIFIIDVEMASCFYRGLDLGLFTHELAFDSSDTSAPVWVGETSEEIEYALLKEYLNKWIELNPDKFDPQLDTFDNLLLESRILSLSIQNQVAMFFLKSFVDDPAKFPVALLEATVQRIPHDTKRKNVVIKMMKERSK